MSNAKIAGAVVLGFLVMIGLWILLSVMGVVGGVAERVTDPDRMVGVYERFFDRCADIQALEAQRDSITTELAEIEDPDRRVRLQSARQAVESQRARTISQYNADADTPTRNFLLSEGLPGELDQTVEYTECAR